MRIGIGLGMTRRGSVDRYSGYSFVFDPYNGFYKPTSNNLVTSLPGYGYTRVGFKYENGPTGVLPFPAHTPGIIAQKGFFARAGLTNYITQSQDFTNAAWTQFNATVVGNAIAAPDGANTADKIIPTAINNGQHGVYRTAFLVTVSGNKYTYSVFAKAAEYDALQITGHGTDVGGNFSANFNLTTGTVNGQGVTGAPVGRIEPSINGWYRCSVTVTANSLSADIRIWVGPSASLASNGLFTGFAGDGIKGLYLWQGQCVDGEGSGAIIHTMASTVAINADIMSVTVPKPSGAFTIFAKVATTGDTASNRRIFAWSDGTVNNIIRMFMSTTTNAVAFQVLNATVAVPITSEVASMPAIRTASLALRFNGTSWRAFVNGAPLGSEQAGAVPPGTQFDIGHQLSTLPMNDAIPKILVKDGNLTDSEVAAIMTSL